MFKYHRSAFIFSADPNIASCNTQNDVIALGNILVSWIGTGQLTGHNYLGGTSFQFSSGLQSAVASGVATHFVFWGSTTTSGTATGWGFKGTIGLPGAGADMEIGNTSLVAGQDYSIGSWTYDVYKGFAY